MLIFAAIALTFSFVPASSLAQRRQVSEEGAIYDQLNAGVFTIYSEYGSGSGFLVDESGIVMTNAHVVSGAKRVRVQLDEKLKIAATILQCDDRRDVAILRINSTPITGLPVLHFASVEDVNYIRVGERVLAIGSPLNQQKVLTTGIVSTVEDRVIMCDVAVNPGNSGGPLLNLAGEVVGMVTFALVEARGPGLGGAIAARVLTHEFDRVPSEALAAAPPAADLYPVFPKDQFPLPNLRVAALRWRSSRERFYLVATAPEGPRPMPSVLGGEEMPPEANFRIDVLTPPALYVQSKKGELAKAKSYARWSKGGESTPYDPFQDLKAWTQSGGEWAPVVLFRVVPLIGEKSGTGWKLLANAIGSAALGVNLPVTVEYEFKDTLEDFDLLINGRVVQDLQRGVAWLPLDFWASNYYVTVKASDLARAGIFAYAPDVFAPDNGVWPQVSLRVTSAGAVHEYPLSRGNLERIAVDFEPYYWTKKYRDIMPPEALLAGGAR